MKRIIVFSALLFISNLQSQSGLDSFWKLSGPKKWWVIWHPTKAKKSLEISKETNRVADSIRKTNLLDGDHAGGQVDAFRHAYWMARLKQEIGERPARSLGKAHEKENYLLYKKRKLEDGVLPDKPSMEMDLHNNEMGLQLTSKNEKLPKNGLIYRIVNAIKEGKMRIIKKDKKGNFLTCEGTLIDKKTLKGKWENNKCLVKSNTIELK